MLQLPLLKNLSTTEALIKLLTFLFGFALCVSLCSTGQLKACYVFALFFFRVFAYVFLFINHPT